MSVGGRGLVQRDTTAQGDGIAQLVVRTQRHEGGIAIAEVQHRVLLGRSIVDGDRVECGRPSGAGDVTHHGPAIVDLVRHAQGRRRRQLHGCLATGADELARLGLTQDGRSAAIVIRHQEGGIAAGDLVRDLGAPTALLSPSTVSLPSALPGA
ncbi:hypothetical protein G6F68_015090 [Rhizopus microsporus]|nr:hypothetical protein G6F68_015090 [Rhizopus microsporus]